MKPDGGSDKMLTNGWQDEAPSWAPDSEWIAFQRTAQGTGSASIYSIHVGGGEAKAIATPQPGAEPNWMGVTL